MFSNYLVPFDGSESSARALATAIQMGTGDEPVDITVLQVAAISDIDYSSFEVAARMAGFDPVGEDQIETLRETYIGGQLVQ